MKTTTKTLLAVYMLLALSCKKENTTIQSSGSTNETAIQDLSAEAKELAGLHAVRIGTQVWKIKDLTTSHYRNGERIPQVQGAAKWAGLTTGAWCWYDNNPAMGKLYNWYAVNDPRGLAPEGWHIPSDAEWTTLTTYLGGEAVAGGKMKEAGTAHWSAPNTGATNSSGFTGLPGGDRYSNGTFGSIGVYGDWWSSTEDDSTLYAWCRDLYTSNGLIFRFFNYKQNGYSVRCLRD